MKCPRCQHENPSKSRLCMACGAGLSARATRGKSGAFTVSHRKSPASEGPQVQDLEKRLAEALDQQTATSEILQIISRSPRDIQPVLDAIAASAARVCGAMDAIIMRVEGPDMRRVAHAGPIPLILPEARRITDGTTAGRAILERRAIHVHDVLAADFAHDYPEAAAAYAGAGWRTTLSVPLLGEGVAIGAITIRRAEVRPFTEKQIKLLETFANQAVIAIENVRLFNETKEALERQTATAEVLRIISTSPTDLQPVLAAVVERAARLCVANDAVIFRDDGDTLTPVATCGVPAVSSVPRTRGTASGRAIVDRQPVHVEDLASPTSIAEFPDANVPRARGIRTQLAVPLLREGEAVGVILIRRFHVQPFTEQQIALLKTFADQAVIAIENVRLFNELQASNRDLTTALDKQTATSDILRVISRSQTDVQPVFDAILTSAVRLLRGYSGTLAQIAGDRIELAAYTSTGAAGDAVARDASHRPLDSDGVHARTIRDRAPMTVANLQTDPRFPERVHAFARARGLLGVITVPLLRHGEALGSIAVARREPGEFNTDELGLLQTFADQAVIAIENVRLFTELRESLEQQTATAEILRVISSSPTDVQPVFEAIGESVVRLMGAAMASVYEFDGTLVHLRTLTPPTWPHAEELRQQYPRPPDARLAAGRVILDRAILHLADLQNDPETPSVTRQVAERMGLKGVLWVPMLREGTPIGVIGAVRGEAGLFSDKQVALLQTFADQAIIAIENVRLFNETREALEQQTATSEILRVIAGSPTNLQPVMDVVAENAARVCGATDALVYRLEDGELRLVASHGDIPAVQSWRLDPGHLSSRAVIDRKPVHVHDISAAEAEFPISAKTAHPRGTRTCLATPLLREGVPIGVISIRRQEVRPFSAREISLLQTFADQAVIAIENVRLFKELETRNRDLTEALERQTATSEILRAISGAQTDINPVFDAIARSAVKLCGAFACRVFRAEDELLPVVGEAYGTPEARALFHGTHSEAVGRDSPSATAVRERRVVQYADVPNDPDVPERYRERARARGYRALMCVPMMRDQVAIGTIAIARQEPVLFSEQQVQLIKTFADQAVIAIENVRLFKELEAANRELAAASQHKSEFLANMSHELRTPLNAVIGFSEVLTERMFGELNEKQDEYLRDIHASGQHLLSLINDILDLSKIEAGRMELEVTDFDLPLAIENAMTLVRERAARRSIALHTTVNEQLGQIQADERKIRQVLLNLLSNAIKFTPEGGRIHVEARSVNESIEVAVTDTGVGIAPEDQEAVFEEFRQVGTAEKKVEGTGLGLALSRKFIELHGGKIWVKSEVGTGSTFTFTIPVRRGE
jgi:GAF domain-containing protein